MRGKRESLMFARFGKLVVVEKSKDAKCVGDKPAREPN